MPPRRQLRPGRLEIGLDEAGRGSLAGPVFAAAAILRPGKRSPTDLNDSKQIRPARRAVLRQWIEEHALAWAVASASPEEIDHENVLQATMTAMHRAIAEVQAQLARTGSLALKPDPPHLLVDGHYFRTHPDLEHTCLVKGDTRFQAIAAASILAKTHRDALMRELAVEHPGYAWDSNKGYPTPPHQRALTQFGPTPWHRRSFRLVY